MASNIRYFAGTLVHTVDDCSVESAVLIVANTPDSALEVLHETAATFYEADFGRMEKTDSRYHDDDWTMIVRVNEVHEIGLAAFEGLRHILPIRLAENVALENLDARVPEGLKRLAKSVVNTLATKGVAVKQTTMLEALAKGFGANNWAVLALKLGQLKAPAPVNAPGSQAVPEAEVEKEPSDELTDIFAQLDNQEGSARVRLDGRTWQVAFYNVDGLSSDDLALELIDPRGEGYGQLFYHGHELVEATVEDFVTLVLKDGSRLTFELQERQWKANVCRTGYGFADVPVAARTAAEAHARALDAAGDHEYRQVSADYEVDWVALSN